MCTLYSVQLAGYCVPERVIPERYTGIMTLKSVAAGLCGWYDESVQFASWLDTTYYILMRSIYQYMQEMKHPNAHGCSTLLFVFVKSL